MEDIKLLDDNFVGWRTRPVLNITIYHDTKFSSCHMPYTNNILHPVSSYHFQSNKKLFQAGNFNVNIRQNLLCFSILRYTQKDTKNRSLWQQLKLCAHYQGDSYEDQCCTFCFESEGTKMPLVYVLVSEHLEIIQNLESWNILSYKYPCRHIPMMSLKTA